MLTEAVHFPVGFLSTIVDVAQLDWQDYGSCREVGLEFFFPKKGDSVAPARTICAGCPVQTECLEYALRSDMHGIWGGATRERRRTIRLERGITDDESREDSE